MAVSTRSTPAPAPNSAGPSATNQPLCALYLVSGLPKSPHTWTLADTDSTTGLHHTEGAVNRWWRPEVLGSTVTPGTGGSKKGLRKKHSAELLKGAGVLSKQDVGKMLSKGLKVKQLVHHAQHILILQ
jgi:nicotinamide N-methyltransferase